MIHRAFTEDAKNECKAFLRKHGLESPTDIFLFVTNSKNEITGVAGITIGECDNYMTGYIEPYQCENNFANVRLYAACEGYMIARRVKYIIVGCEANETTEKMYEQLGYLKWSKNMNQYIKVMKGI